MIWKSSKRRVATVNRNGQVIARGKGTAVITAKIAGTNVYAQSVVTVKNYITMRVRTTGYCNCRSCAGKWAGCATASGTRPKEKRTIAVDKRLIHLGTKVKIGNIIYTAEDTGSAIKNFLIDGHGDVIMNILPLAMGNSSADRIMQFKVRLKGLQLLQVEIYFYSVLFQFAYGIQTVKGIASKTADAFGQNHIVSFADAVIDHSLKFRAIIAGSALKIDVDVRQSPVP